MNGELLVDSRLASADLEATEAVSRHAARCLIPHLCFYRTGRQFARVRPRYFRTVIGGDANVDGSPHLGRDTRQKARQLADSQFTNLFDSWKLRHPSYARR